MSSRNLVRAAVAALGCVLVIHGTMEILAARAADAASCTVASTGAGCSPAQLPTGISTAPLGRPARPEPVPGQVGDLAQRSAGGLVAPQA